MKCMFGNVCNLTAKLLLNSPGFMKSCLLVEVSYLGQVVRFVLDVRRRSDFQILMTDHGLLLSRGRLRRKVQPDNGHFLQHVMTVYFSFFSRSQGANTFRGMHQRAFAKHHPWPG